MKIARVPLVSRPAAATATLSDRPRWAGDDEVAERPEANVLDLGLVKPRHQGVAEFVQGQDDDQQQHPAGGRAGSHD